MFVLLGIYHIHRRREQQKLHYPSLLKSTTKHLNIILKRKTGAILSSIYSPETPPLRSPKTLTEHFHVTSWSFLHVTSGRRTFCFLRRRNGVRGWSPVGMGWHRPIQFSHLGTHWVDNHTASSFAHVSHTFPQASSSSLFLLQSVCSTYGNAAPR